MAVPRYSFLLTEPTDLPLALAIEHRSLPTGTVIEVDLPVHASRADLVVRGAGFRPDPTTGAHGLPVESTRLTVTREWELPDHVGADMRILLIGLNPSPAASDAGVGFARAGNRFWPALLAGGLATVDRDPQHLLAHQHVGMTDMVKRTTARAAELSSDEFAAGLDRLDQLISWLEPRAVCFVGLQGWRSAIDRKAVSGLQPSSLGGRPTYLMPNPSGLNANHHLDDFVGHFRAVADLADSAV